MTTKSNFYRPIHLKTAEKIKQAALQQLTEQWNFSTESLLRMPMHGLLFDEVNAELMELSIGEIGIWTIFARGANGRQNVHCDAYDSETRVRSGLIIPVLGTAGSSMQWIDETSIDLKAVKVRDGRSFLFTAVNKIDLKVLEELEISEPIIARLNIPHRAIASATQPRAVVSIKIRGNPELL